MIRFLLVPFLFFFTVQQSIAATIYSINTGFWNDVVSVWSNSSQGPPCGCSPAAGDDVVIEGLDGVSGNPIVITVNASPGVNYNSITIQELNDGDGSSLALLTGVTLLVDNGASGGDLNITDISGGLDSPFVTLTGSSILSIAGSILIDDGDQAQKDITLNGSSTLKIGGDFDLTLGAGGDVTFGTSSTVDYFGTGAQSVLSGYSYGKLKFSGAGTKTFQPGTVQIRNSSATCFDPSGATSVVCTGADIQFTGLAQTIPGLPGGSSYSTLTIGSNGTKTFSSTTIINVSGTLVLSGINTYVVGTSTINFNGSVNQTIPFGLRTNVTYNDIQINCTGGSGATLGTSINSTKVAGNITVQTGILNNGGFAIAGNGTKTFQVNNGATFILTGTSAMPTGFGTTTLQATSTVDFNGNGSQTIPAINFGHLTSSNTGARTLASSGTIGVSGTFTPGTNAYTNTGSTLDFNGTGNQSVPMPGMALYNDIQINCTGPSGATLAAAVTATNVAGNITVQTGILNNGGFAIAGNGTKTFQVNNGATFILTGTSAMPSGFGTTTLQATSTVDFNGNGSQTIAALNYGHLTSSNTGARTLASSGTIGVSGTFIPGTNAYTTTGSTVNFNASGAQTVPALPGSVNYNSITVSGSGTKSLGGNSGITGVLTISAGIFDVAGYDFTLISNASGTASIAPITAPADFTGNLIMQRYSGTGVTDWRFLSSAVTGRTIADWTDDFATSGFTGSTDPGNSFVSIYSYDETILGDKDSGFVAATNTTNPITEGVGYWVYMGPNPLTFDVTGAPNKFFLPLPVTFTDDPGQPDTEDGWNMVANPYPSAISWDAAGWTKTNINSTIYIWNPAFADFASYTGDGTCTGSAVNGGSCYIASQQAFWVQANAAAPALAAVEEVKAASQDPTHLKMEVTPNTSHCPMTFQDFPIPLNTNATPNRIVLTASGGGHPDNETVIRFMPGATDNFDGQYDGWDLPGYYTNLSSVITGNKDLSINSLPDLTSNVAIPIRLKVATTGTYSLRRDSVLMLPTSACVFLEDKLTGTMTDLRAAISYSFTISDTTVAPRFVLHINTTLIKNAVNVSCYGGNDGKAIAKGTGNGPWNYVWKDYDGNTLQTTNNSTTADTLFNCVRDTYSVSVYGGFCGPMTDTISIKEPALLIADFTATTYTVDLSVSNSVAFTNNSSGASGYIWNFGDASPTDVSVNPTHSYTLVGVYTVMLIATNGTCPDTISKIITVINSNPTSVSATAFFSSVEVVYDNGNPYLLFSLDKITRVNVSVYNMVGEEISSQKNLHVKNDRIKLNIPSTSAGIYIAVSEMSEAVVSKKIILPAR